LYNLRAILIKTILKIAAEILIKRLSENSKIGEPRAFIVGLKNIGVHLIYVEPGKDTTEYHKHYYEEECIYVLAGEGTLEIGDESYLFEKGDFATFPADTAAHSLKNTGAETLVCLVMGQRLEQDVADYPQRAKRLYRNSGEWNLVDLADIIDPRSLQL